MLLSDQGSNESFNTLEADRLPGAKVELELPWVASKLCELHRRFFTYQIANMSTRAVALLIEMSSGYCRGLLEGIHAYAKLRGDWSIYLNEQERGAIPPVWLNDWRGDGIIARIETDQIGEALQRLNIPIVDLSAARRIPNIPWADTDDEAIARLAIEHFLDRGFNKRRLLRDAGFAWSNSRRNFFRSLAFDAGCEFFEHQVAHRYDPLFQWDHVRASLARWLQSLPKPTAIMTCNDYLGKHLLDLCRSLQISVPEEVAVLGVDDDRLLCSLCTPSLSSIAPNTFQTVSKRQSCCNN